jgi:hypothetical protein
MSEPMPVWRSNDGLYIGHGRASRDLREIVNHLQNTYGNVPLELRDLDSDRLLIAADAPPEQVRQTLAALDNPAPSRPPSRPNRPTDPSTWSPAMKGSREASAAALYENPDWDPYNRPDSDVMRPHAPPPTASPPPQPTSGAAPTDEDRRAHFAKALPIANIVAGKLLNAGVWNLGEYERLQRNMAAATAELMPPEIYERFRKNPDGSDSDAYDNLERTFRPIPAGVDPDKWARDGDQVMREIGAAAHLDAWLGGVVSDEQALQGIKEAARVEVKDDPRGAGWTLHNLTTGWLAPPDENSRLKLEPARPPEHEWGEVDPAHVAEFNARIDAEWNAKHPELGGRDTSKPSGRHRDDKPRIDAPSPAPSIAESMGLPPIERPSEAEMRSLRASRGLEEHPSRWDFRRAKQDLTPAPAVMAHPDDVIVQSGDAGDIIEAATP